MNYFLPLISFVICFVLLQILLRSFVAKRVVDEPNHRSLHSGAVPRIGGIAIFLAIGIAGRVMGALDTDIWFAACMLVLVSLIDDLKGLPFFVRLFVHFIAAFIFVSAITTNMLLGTFLVFCVVWMINLYNFMDGSDGLAGGMAVFGFTFYGIAALTAGADDFAILNFVVAAAGAAFLILNFNPARVFMGDSGSILLGFLAAALGILGWRLTLWPLWFPVLVFSPFIIDATVTLLKRLFRGEKVWHAHKEHYYQKLVQMGLGHRKTALIEYMLMAAVGITAVLTVQLGGEAQVIILIIWALIYLRLMVMAERYWNKFNQEK